MAATTIAIKVMIATTIVIIAITALRSVLSRWTESSSSTNLAYQTEGFPHRTARRAYFWNLAQPS